MTILNAFNGNLAFLWGLLIGFICSFAKVACQKSKMTFCKHIYRHLPSFPMLFSLLFWSVLTLLPKQLPKLCFCAICWYGRLICNNWNTSCKKIKKSHPTPVTICTTDSYFKIYMHQYPCLPQHISQVGPHDWQNAQTFLHPRVPNLSSSFFCPSFCTLPSRLFFNHQKRCLSFSSATRHLPFSCTAIHMCISFHGQHSQ